MMPRFSLRQLLILVAFASVTCAALARPGYWWHAAIALAVSITAIGMVIAGIVCDSRRRAFAVGWLVLAVGYLAVVLGPWTGSHLAPQLLTSRGLARLEAKWHGDQPSPLMFPQAFFDYDSNSGGAIDLGNRWSDYYGYEVSGLVVRPQGPVQFVSSNYTVFQGTAHWLIAVVLGQFGGWLALALTASRDHS